MRKLMGVVILLSTTTAYGAAPVEEAGAEVPSAVAVPAQVQVPPRTAPAPAPAQVAQSGGQQGLIDLHYELQEMREELRQLRGIVEEQGHELRQLRQRQMDDYQDLDRRLSGSSGAAPKPQGDEGQGFYDSGSDVAEPSRPAASSADLGEEAGPVYKPVQNEQASASQRDEYEEIFNKLKARKIDEAQAGFKTFVAKYPDSAYSANAWYWLGEIYLLQNDLPGAERAFGTVTQDFPAHAKASDAKFKLGKVFHLEGKNEEAKKLLTEVANSNSRSAALAQTYLQDNF